jgi:hypothetical protein
VISEHTGHCLKIAGRIGDDLIRVGQVKDVRDIAQGLNGPKGDEVTAIFLRKYLAEPGDTAAGSLIRPEAVMAFSSALASDVRPVLSVELQSYLRKTPDEQAAYRTRIPT